MNKSSAGPGCSKAVESGMGRISIRETNCVIHWIVIYTVDIVLQPDVRHTAVKRLSMREGFAFDLEKLHVAAPSCEQEQGNFLRISRKFIGDE